jgi:ribonuclease HI
MSFTDFTTGHNRMELQAAIAALWQRLKRIAKSSSSSVPAGRDPSASQASPL